MIRGKVILETNLPDLNLLKRGKVRDIYAVNEHLLIVATDRISAFDVVLPNGIPDKGRVLTQISRFWFEKTRDIIPNHLITTEVGEFPARCQKYGDLLRGRGMLVERAKPLPVESIVRGYLSGSAWEEYKKTSSVCGIPLAEGLVESGRLDEPIFTPSTKAEGGHDESISFERMKELIGENLAQRIKEVSLKLYLRARRIAEEKAIIIADTKFEFGLKDSQLILIDELLTPDSSRFWPKEKYQAGRSPESLDKQFVRDYLAGLSWDKNPPAPSLPDEVIEQTAARYLEMLAILTGGSLE